MLHKGGHLIITFGGELIGRPNTGRKDDGVMLKALIRMDYG